jgi:hypothetical protein
VDAAGNTKHPVYQPVDGQDMGGKSVEKLEMSEEEIDNVKKKPVSIDEQAGNGREWVLRHVVDSKLDHEVVSWVDTEREGFPKTRHLRRLWDHETKRDTQQKVDCD